MIHELIIKFDSFLRFYSFNLIFLVIISYYLLISLLITYFGYPEDNDDISSNLPSLNRVRFFSTVTEATL